ncbi:MAG TPA: D-glycerate dehydrogenase, partial [Dehalococcoidia bacterium]|nr:D-glycerate dehydrogenase [Dehalococcoidia bacterium]
MTTGSVGKPRVYLGVGMPPHVRAWIDAACEVEEYAGGGRAPREALVEALPRVVGLLTSNQVRIDNDLIAANPQLVVVSNVGVGYDNVDIPFATAHGLLVCNTPDVLTDAVADLTYGFIIALARRIVDAHQFIHAGSWQPGRPMQMGVDIRGKTLGILGFGRIGHAVARRAAPFGLRPIYYDPVRDPKAEDEGLAEYAEREQVLREADFLTVLVFLDEATRGHIGAEDFALMKPSAFFINTSRGPVLRQRDLAEALRTGQIAGAALDVFEREPIARDEELLSAPNLIVSPHIGSNTVETRQAMNERA